MTLLTRVPFSRRFVLGSGAEISAGAELSEVDDVALPDAHAGASVEPGGAGEALGIHAQGNLADAAPVVFGEGVAEEGEACLLYTSPSPRDGLLSRMPSSA